MQNDRTEAIEGIKEMRLRDIKFTSQKAELVDCKFKGDSADDLVAMAQEMEMRTEDFETERAERLMSEFVKIRANRYESVSDIQDHIAKRIIEGAFAGTQNDVRLLEERIVLSAIQYYENELARYKQALEDSIKREEIARKVIEDKNKKYRTDERVPFEWGLHPHEIDGLKEWLKIMKSDEVHITINDGEPKIMCYPSDKNKKYKL